MPAKRGAMRSPAASALRRRRRRRRHRRPVRRLARARGAACSVCVLDARRARRGDVARRRRACSRRSPRPTPASRRCSRLGLAARARWPAFAAELREAARRRRRLPRVRHAASSRATATRPRRSSASARCASASGCGRAAAARRGAPRSSPRWRRLCALALDVPDDHAVDPRLVVAALAARLPSAPASVLRPAPRSPRARVAASAPRRRSSSPPARGRPPWATSVARCARSRASRCACATRPGPGLLDRVCAATAATSSPAATGATSSARPSRSAASTPPMTAGGVYELLRDASELVPGVLELERRGGARRPAPRHARQRPDARPLAVAPARRVGHRPLPQRRAAGPGHRRADRRRAGRRGVRACLRAPSASRPRRRRGDPRQRRAARARTARRSSSCWPTSASRPRARGVAVAVDGEVVPRGRVAERRVADGDHVEALTAMQGG